MRPIQPIRSAIHGFARVISPDDGELWTDFWQRGAMEKPDEQKMIVFNTNWLKPLKILELQLREKLVSRGRMYLRRNSLVTYEYHLFSK